MRAVGVAVLCAVLVPAVARGEPIPVVTSSAVGGFSQTGLSMSEGMLDLGTVTMPGVEAVGMVFISGLKPQDVIVSFMLEGIGQFDSLKLELFNPAGPSDRYDEGEQPSYVPEGYTTSNDFDGLSFAQYSGLERSAVFAGGSAQVLADELTHRGDVLLFSGLAGAERARVTFGLRNGMQFFNRGNHRGILLRISAVGDQVATPEPASMLLLGTGLAGLVAARRRRVAGRRAANRDAGVL